MPSNALVNRLLEPVDPPSRVALSVLETVNLADCSLAEIEAVVFRAVEVVNAQFPAAEDRALGRATVAGWVRAAEHCAVQGTVRGTM